MESHSETNKQTYNACCMPWRRWLISCNKFSTISKTKVCKTFHASHVATLPLFVRNASVFIISYLFSVLIGTPHVHLPAQGNGVRSLEVVSGQLRVDCMVPRSLSDRHKGEDFRNRTHALVIHTENHCLRIVVCIIYRRYMAEILLIQCKTPTNHSITSIISW